MNDILDPVTGASLKFPKPADEAFARAEEFRRLSVEERWKQISELMEFGMKMVRDLPRRAEIERRMEAKEVEWQRLQTELFSKYGK
jgi:hypothetical protein